MKNFEQLQLMSQNEFAKWLDKHLAFDDAPHMVWFGKNYCDKCDRVELLVESGYGTYKQTFAYCECEHKCRFFPDVDEVPDSLETLKLWLEAEVEG